MRIKGTLHEDRYTFYTNISLDSSYNEKCFKVVEKIKKQILCSITFF